MVIVSTEKTDESYFITIKSLDFNVYIDVFETREIIVSVFKNQSAFGNWSGTMDEFINKLCNKPLK